MYEVGDRVIVRDDLEQYKEYGNDVFCDEMEECLGCEAVITEVFMYSDGNKYLLDIDVYGFNWTDEMLLPDESFKMEMFSKFLRSQYENEV